MRGRFMGGALWIDAYCAKLAVKHLLPLAGGGSAGQKYPSRQLVGCLPRMPLQAEEAMQGQEAKYTASTT